MRARALLYGAALCLTASGCFHDLNALKAKRNMTGGLRNSDAGKPSTLSMDGGVAGENGGGASGAGGAPSEAACEPCPAVNDAGTALGLRSCCRGAINQECGLTFGQGSLCLARGVPGKSNSACPAAKQGATDLEGCCRPDGRCGLSGTMFDLGCVARDEILPALGVPRVDATACVYECVTDDDCGGVPGGYICGEDPKDTTHMRRICLNDCVRDQDCPKGQICTLGSDLANDAIRSYCRTPIGTGAVGDYCSAPRDCVHGICLQLKDMGNPYCTELCTNDPDCPASRPNCFGSKIDTPSKASTQNFSICGL
jgi:hypothetical protein